MDVGGHDFGNVVEQINWTNEDSLKDDVGHGTHVAGEDGWETCVAVKMSEMFRVLSWRARAACDKAC